MPRGVGQAFKAVCDEIAAWLVIEAVMPRGVGQADADAVSALLGPVIEAVMPRGVGQIGRAMRAAPRAA